MRHACALLPADYPGDASSGLMSTADTVRHSTELLSQMTQIPADDMRLVRLAELAPTVDTLLETIPDDEMLHIGHRGTGADADILLDQLVSLAARRPAAHCRNPRQVSS